MGRLTPFLDERVPLLTARTLTSLSLSMRAPGAQDTVVDEDGSAHLDLLARFL